jgi:hypothetical protein
MILSKEVSSALCKIDEEYKAYLRGNGTILVQLQKALYGCFQSVVLWYDELSTTRRPWIFAESLRYMRFQ